MKNKYIKIAFLSLVATTSSQVVAQVKVGDNPKNISQSAILEVESTNKGVLMPRVALSSITDATTIASPANALTVFNTATAGTAPNDVVPGYYYWSTAESKWVRLLDNPEALVVEPWQIQGTTNKANANNQHIYQNGYVAIGNFSSTEAVTNLDVRGSIRVGQPSSQEIDGTSPIGITSAAFGSNNNVSANNAFATGFNNRVEGYNSAAVGSNNIVKSDNAFVAGNTNYVENNANDLGVSLLGNNNTVYSKNSFVSGNNLKSSFGFETVLGTGNAITELATSTSPNNNPQTGDPLFQLGNGISTANGKNAITVLRDSRTAIGVNGMNEAALPTELLDLGGDGNFGQSGLRIRNINSVAYTGNTATDKVVVADASGVLKTVTVASLAPTTNAANGLTKNAGTNTIELGGDLNRATTIATTISGTTYPLNITGLPADGATTDNIIVASTGGQLKTITRDNLVQEPLQVQGTTNKATLNTQNVYQMGTFAIRKTQAINNVALDIAGAVRGGQAHADETAGTSTIGTNSAAFGSSNKASGASSFATGNANVVSGPNSFASGSTNTISGASSAVFGGSNTVSGNGSLVNGIQNNVQGLYAAVSGNENIVTGSSTLVSGYSNDVKQSYSAALGYDNTINGVIADGFYGSFATGFSNTINGTQAATFGVSNTAGGNMSATFGFENSTSSYASAAFGHSNIVATPYEFVTGTYNAITTSSIAPNGYSSGIINPGATDPAFQIGNGTGSSSRQNSLTVLVNGNTGIGITGTEAAAKPTERLDVGTGNVRVRTIYTNVGNNATDRMVVADPSGVLKTLPIPSGSSTNTNSANSLQYTLTATDVSNGYATINMSSIAIYSTTARLLITVESDLSYTSTVSRTNRTATTIRVNLGSGVVGDKINVLVIETSN